MNRVGRNEPCPCGSGIKHKKCCLPKKERPSGKTESAEDSTVDDWGYELFGVRFPDIAEKETRHITVTGGGHTGPPKGIYVFHEMFCREKGCDCRRVFFYVTFGARHKLEAVVCYGWESKDFYRRWYKDSDLDAINELKGPSLNLGSPQSEYAPAILDLVENVLINDRDYIDRIKRHYNMFKEDVDKQL
jgi:hypothetical protein